MIGKSSLNKKNHCILILLRNTLSTVSDIPTLPYINTRHTRSRRTDGDYMRYYEI